MAHRSPGACSLNPHILPPTPQTCDKMLNPQPGPQILLCKSQLKLQLRFRILINQFRTLVLQDTSLPAVVPKAAAVSVTQEIPNASVHVSGSGFIICRSLFGAGFVLQHAQRAQDSSGGTASMLLASWFGFADLFQGFYDQDSTKKGNRQEQQQ